MLSHFQNTVFLPVSLVCVLGLASSADAIDVEKREFSIIIDGKESGISTMTLTVGDDGVTTVQGACSVKFTKLLFKYNFNIESTEWWKDGHLIGLKSKSSENSKKNEVSGSGDGKQFRIRINGVDRTIKPEAWTTSYWKLADPKFHNKAVPLVDPEDGKEYNAQLQYIGTEQLTINKVPQNCYHFKVTGGPQTADLWFDRYHRLVRQEFVEQGSRVIIQLNSIQR